ncbi:MAG TPA: 5-methyltetrahydropteroyltriglutamate--homocysteine S-methyltransferase, partial [Treponemataceae bacterium]|nr:5-methyltetrahydropteroyltriglutamate--homocysteine S-methyltransferase [Treponemataceae bacterium]
LENYENAIKESIARCITLQENLGLDVLVHGEYERNDMAEYFGENLNGFVITKNAWVQSYGTRCVKPPVIFSDISRLCDITVKWITYAQSLTSKRVKGMLTGPTTIVNWSFPCEDIPLDISAYQIAQALREEVLSLEKNGIEIIQIDEAALKERLPLRKIDRHEKYLDWAVKAFRYCSSGVKDTTQIHTHMCYSEFTGIISDIDNLDADVITFESSRSALDILYPLKDHHFETQTGPGVYDIHSSRIPSADEIEECIEKILAVLPYNAVWINPDCGLKTRTDEQVYSALHAMMEAVKRVRTRLVNENKI